MRERILSQLFLEYICGYSVMKLRSVRGLTYENWCCGRESIVPPNPRNFVLIVLHHSTVFSNNSVTRNGRMAGVSRRWWDLETSLLCYFVKRITTKQIEWLNDFYLFLWSIPLFKATKFGDNLLYSTAGFSFIVTYFMHNKINQCYRHVFFKDITNTSIPHWIETLLPPHQFPSALSPRPE